jgi:hypothetical protein
MAHFIKTYSRKRVIVQASQAFNPPKLLEPQFSLDKIADSLSAKKLNERKLKYPVYVAKSENKLGGKKKLSRVAENVSSVHGLKQKSPKKKLILKSSPKEKRPLLPPMIFTPLFPPKGSQISLSDDDS